MPSVAARFRQVYKGSKNFMTPEILEYGKTGPFLYEISKGEGFSHKTIYGLTILEDCPTKQIKTVRRPDLSSCYHSLSEVRDAITALKTQED